MIKFAAIIYVVVAAISITVMAHIYNSTRKEGEYPEGVAESILFCILALILAALWPMCPVLIIGLLIWDKIREVKG